MKWLLIGVGILLVIAITVGVTVLVTSGGSGGNGSTTNTTTSTAGGQAIASADDKGPVEIITVEPTCQSWRPLQNTLAAAESSGWANRDPSIPEPQWNSSLRSQYDTVRSTLQTVTQQATPLAEQTPHRVMRELYQQFTAYGRAYADSLSTYTADDDYLAQTTVGFSTTISSVCDAIEHGNISERASGVGPASSPTNPTNAEGSADAARFLLRAPTQCSQWVKVTDTFDTDLQDWSKVDPSVPASQWDPQQQSLYAIATTKMTSYASDIERIGRDSANATFEDLATFASLYFRAFVAAIPSYTQADTYVVNPALVIRNVIISACQAAAG